MNYFLIVGVDNGYQCGTGREYEFFWVLGAPTNIEPWSRFRFRKNRKKFGKLLDMKWADGYDEALE